MQPNAVQASMINEIPVHVRSTFSEKSGTKIVSENESDYKKVITNKRKEEVLRKLEFLSDSKYKVGDYKGSIKAIRRSEKYY